MVPYNSVDAFRYIWLNLRIMGLNPFPRYRILYTIYAIFINTMMPVIIPIQQVAQAFLVETLAQLMSNLSISLEWMCGCLKYFVLVQWHSELRAGHAYIEPLDARVQRYDEELAIMKRIVKNCHLAYIMYNVGFWSTLLFFTVNAAINRRIIFEAYIPWDWKASTNKYILAFVYQFVTSGFQLVLNLASDCYAITYLYVTLGHLETLGMRISRIGYDRAVSQEDNYNELIQCIHDHWNILHFFDHIRPVISRTILIQFMVTAFALCLATFYFVFFNSNIGMMLTTVMYFGVLFAQVLPCCYFVNELMLASDDLTTALYSCNWMDQTQKFRKTVIIFMQRTQKTTSIVAGSLAPVTLQTCLKILRFSFSLFTLLTQM